MSQVFKNFVKQFQLSLVAHWNNSHVEDDVEVPYAVPFYNMLLKYFAFKCEYVSMCAQESGKYLLACFDIEVWKDGGVVVEDQKAGRLQPLSLVRQHVTSKDMID